MNLIRNDQGKLAHPRSLVPQERVRFFVSAEDDVVSSKPWVRAIIVACGYPRSNVIPVGFLDCRVSLEFLELLARERAERSQVDCLAPMFEDVLQDTQFCDQRLAAGGRTGQNKILPLQKPCLDSVLL